MKIFYKGGGWDSKVNFVDENNVLLGYDEHDDCCSDGGWFISDDPKAWLKETFKEESMELLGWVFDTKYFEQPKFSEDDMYEGGTAQFRIVNGEQQKFITLYNLHNGYYSKGFEFKNGEAMLQEDSI